MNIEVTSIKIKIEDQELELTIEAARDLFNKLQNVFGSANTITYPAWPITYPSYPIQPYYGGSGGGGVCAL